MGERTAATKQVKAAAGRRQCGKGRGSRPQRGLEGRRRSAREPVAAAPRVLGTRPALRPWGSRRSPRRGRPDSGEPGGGSAGPAGGGGGADRTLTLFARRLARRAGARFVWLTGCRGTPRPRRAPAARCRREVTGPARAAPPLPALGPTCHPPACLGPCCPRK